MSVNQPGDVAYGFSQALLGVPSKPILAQRSPTTNDKAQIGTTWIDQVANTVFVLTSIVDNVANWVETDSSSSITEIITDAGNVFPVLGVINALGGANIITTGAGNTLTIAVHGTTNHSLQLGNAGGSLTSLGVATNGQLPIGSTGANPVLAALTAGTDISIVNGAGSITINSTVPQAIEDIVGDNAQTASGATVDILGGANIITAGDNAHTLTIAVHGTTNHAIQLGNSTGSLTSLGVATNGQLPIGSAGVNPVLATLTAGTDISIVNGAGSITINSTVPQAIEQLVGDNLQNASGPIVDVVGGANITTAGDNALTLTIAVSGTTDHAVQVGNSGGSLTSLGVGTTGQVLIGSTAANPAFGALGVNSGLTAHSLLLGQGTSAITALGAATDGQLPIGSTGVDPVLTTLTAGSGINITNGAGSITIAATGGAGITTLDGNVGSATGATVTIAGGSNINTSATASTLTVNLDNTVTISGNFITTGGSITIPATSSSTVGRINQAGSSFIHSFGDPSNAFIGQQSGGAFTASNLANYGLGFQSLFNLTSGIGNIGVGYQTLFSLTSGNGNTVIGNDSCAGLTTGSNNTAVGSECLINVAGSYNTYLGALSGTSATAGTESSNIYINNVGVMSESNTMRLGTSGGGNGQVSTSYIAGVAGVTVANSAAVLIDTTSGQLGTIASSRRYKENIKDMEHESSPILNLRPVSFSYKNDTSRENHYGLIAEEVDEIMPDLVTYNRDKEPETIRYHELPALLLNELQKQHAVIVELSRRLERLEKRGSYESTT